MNPIVILAVLLFVSVAGNVAEWVVISGKNDTILAQHNEIEKVWKVENKALAAKLELANGEIENVHAMMDAISKQATERAQAQQESARAIAGKLQATTDENNALFQQLQEKINARPVLVTQLGVPDGWDPVVDLGMHQLKCVQLRAAAGGQGDFPDCRVQDGDSAGRSGLIGDQSGADYPRPTAKQQLEFLNWAWRLRDWGASCYADKRAIAASQAGPVTP
jgi:hypothetical protein